MKGEWVFRHSRSTRFSVPQFVHSDELNDVLRFLPGTTELEAMADQIQPMISSPPRHAGAKLLDKLLRFNEAADDIFRSNASRLAHAYQIVALSQPDTGTTSMTLGQIAMTILQKKHTSELTPAMMWAVHRALVHSQNIQCDKFTFRQNFLYEVYPHQNIIEINKVRDWLRNFQESIIDNATHAYSSGSSDNDALKFKNSITGFVKKARDAIMTSRRTRGLSPNGSLGPSSVKVRASERSKTTYRCVFGRRITERERTIIRYLDAWALSRYLNKLTPLPALGPMILRAVGLYEGHELDSSMGFTFLQELGVITPWENRTIYDVVNLKLPGHGDRFEEITQLQRMADDEFDSTTPLQDSMAQYRIDWGDLPVFCIDSADTLERDDGVSLEAVENSDTEHWVHVHVANPSAFIQPDSALAKYAAQLSESVYLPERKYPMLHPALTDRQLSLAAGRPCLTFSARVSMQGEILEKKISPAWVHNVNYMTPHAVGVALGINKNEEAESDPLLRVGEFPIPSHQQTSQLSHELPQHHINLLDKLFNLSKAIRCRRIRNGAQDYHQTVGRESTFPRVYLGDDVPPFQLQDSSYKTFEGDPSISIERMTAAVGLIPQMVSDLMILAGEVCASWSAERHIPIPYRGTMRNPEPASSPEQYMRNVIEPQLAKDGHADPRDLATYLRLVGQIAVSSSPLEHISLGIPAYCKATSPLRRHVDMYAHWQIEAAIRQEAKTGASLIGSSTEDESYLPFSRAEVEAYGSTVVPHEIKIRQLKDASQRHWIIQALFRAFHFKEAPLPETFVARALEPFGDRHPGTLEGWHARVKMSSNEATEGFGGIKVGDLWEVKIEKISTFFKHIDVTPLRLLNRKEGKMVEG